jgi:hypothetical protein
VFSAQSVDALKHAMAQQNDVIPILLSAPSEKMQQLPLFCDLSEYCQSEFLSIVPSEKPDISPLLDRMEARLQNSRQKRIYF